MKIVFVPNYRGNPYLDLLDQALQGQGINVLDTDVLYPTKAWLRLNRHDIDVLHFQWLQGFYQNRRFGKSLKRVIAFYQLLAYAKHLGYPIVWTMHNLYPHERPHPILDWVICKIMLTFTDAVFVHCNKAKRLLCEEFHYLKDVYITPHGHYIEAYPQHISKSTAREQLGIPLNCLVFLHLGGLRKYKGVPHLVHSFMSLNDPLAQLIIAGQDSRGYRVIDYLPASVKQDPRIRMDISWISDNKVALYHFAADFVVSAFENILTSGSIMLALSFGRPVIAPALGCLPELVPPNAGFLYDPQDPEGLYKALQQSLHAPLDAMGKCALEVATQYRWDMTAEIIASAYKEVQKIK